MKENGSGNEKLSVSVYGAWYVGLPTAAVLAENGHSISVVDIDEEKIKTLNEGKLPLQDEGLLEWLQNNADNLEYISDIREWFKNDILMICVGTAINQENKLDTWVIEDIAIDLAENIQSNDTKKTFVIKSTVPVGTTNDIRNKVHEILNERIVTGNLKQREDLRDYIEFVMNPEFLPEWKWYLHAKNPNRTVVGIETLEWKKIMQKLYSFLESPILFHSFKTAEFEKMAANIILTIQITVINDLAYIARKLGINFEDVIESLKYDERIGLFIHPWPGFGWYCFPKDIIQWLREGLKNGFVWKSMLASIDSNQSHKELPFEILTNYIPDLRNKNIAVLWLAFKAGSDNVKESASINVVNKLTLASVENIKVYDPKAMESFKKVMGKYQPVLYEKDIYNATMLTEAVVIMTEWSEFSDIDLQRLADVMTGKKLIVDARRILTKKYTIEEIESYGFTYDGIGVGYQYKSEEEKIIASQI